MVLQSDGMKVRGTMACSRETTPSTGCSSVATKTVFLMSLAFMPSSHRIHHFRNIFRARVGELSRHCGHFTSMGQRVCHVQSWFATSHTRPRQILPLDHQMAVYAVPGRFARAHSPSLTCVTAKLMSASISCRGQARYVWSTHGPRRC